jgi:superfamily I DNA/RNA helicase
MQLDEYQKQIIENDTSIKIIAGAGSGKTFSLLKKIEYLINNKNIKEDEILMISFTNKSTNDIKSKLKYNIEVLTFHKLAIKILDDLNYNYKLTNNNYLEYIIDEYLYNIDNLNKLYILKYLEYEFSYNRLIKTKVFISFKKMIYKYIMYLKSNNYNIRDILNIKYNKLESKIVTIILNIYKVYKEELHSTNTVDLDDLIVLGSNNIYKTNYKYKYIFVDEFQDTSQIRFNLVYNLAKKCNSKFICVGDDWQSIYKFTGCDLFIFLNINKYFNDLVEIKYKYNYRNTEKLVYIASSFIEKNKYQIKKELLTTNKTDLFPLEFISYRDSKKEFKSILDKLINKDTLILFRNNFDIYEYIDKDIILKEEYLIYKDYSFKYMTIHKSKGLESDYVVVLNCNNNLLGFPNKLEDSNIIKKLCMDKEMDYAEERRLMYVAITRARYKTYLLYNINSPSIFIKELKSISKKF